jgi:hypothetical protein
MRPIFILLLSDYSLDTRPQLHGYRFFWLDQTRLFVPDRSSIWAFSCHYRFFSYHLSLDPYCQELTTCFLTIDVIARKKKEERKNQRFSVRLPFGPGFILLKILNVFIFHSLCLSLLSQRFVVVLENESINSLQHARNDWMGKSEMRKSFRESGEGDDKKKISQ